MDSSRTDHINVQSHEDVNKYPVDYLMNKVVINNLVRQNSTSNTNLTRVNQEKPITKTTTKINI